MCCITIETDVLVANFFGSPESGLAGMDGVELEVIEKCARVLANNLPGYVFYDLSPKKIAELVEENKEFVLNDGKMYYRGPGIDRRQYNKVYVPSIARRIGEIVDGFFHFGLYNKEIERQMQVQA